MTSHDILVIGGGFAGVAAAAALRGRALDVALLDDRASLGGRARSDALGGLVIDTGAQLVASTFTRAVRLLGGGPPHEGSAQSLHALIPARGRDVFVRGGERHAIQFGSVRSLLAFGALGAREKVKLGRALLPLLARHRAALDATAAHIPPELDRESARAFVERTVGARAADALVEPAFNSLYASLGEEVSLAFYLTLGRYGTDSEMLAPRGGWSPLLARALADSATGRAATHVAGVRITALGASDHGVTAHAEDGRAWHGRAAVVATGVHAARALLAGVLPASPLVEWLETIELRPTFTLAAALDATADRSAFGILRHRGESRSVSACAVHGAKLGAHAPSGTDAVIAWPTPAAAAELHSRPAAEIVAALMPEVEELVPAVRGHVTHVRLYRAEAGTPLVRPGYAAHRAAGRALAAELPLPIALAGDYLTTPTIEGAVTSGEAAAAALAARLAATGA